MQKIPLKDMKKLLYYTDDQTLEQFAEKDCGISILGVIQTLTGCGLRNQF